MWTMAENITKLKICDTFENGTLFESANKSSKQDIKNKRITLSKHTNASASEIKKFDAVSEIEKNEKELKTLKFEADNVVSAGLSHVLIPRDAP